MKRKLTLISALLTLSLIISCSLGAQEDNLLIEDLSTQKDPKKWQEQIEEARNLNATRSGDVGSLTLIQYTKIGSINSEADIERVQSLILALDTYLPHYEDSTFMNFDIMTVSEIAAITNRSASFVDVHKYLESELAIGQDLLDVEWEFKGKKFKSLCVVSDKEGKVVYDQIMCNVMGEVKTITHKSTTKATIDDFNEYGTFMKDKDYKFHGEYDFHVVWLNTCVGIIYVNIFTDFIHEGEGYFAVSNLSTYASAKSELGWKANSRVRTTAFHLGRNGLHEFAWGYAIDFWDASVYWNGLFFEVPYDATKKGSGLGCHHGYRVMLDR